MIGAIINALVHAAQRRKIYSLNIVQQEKHQMPDNLDTHGLTGGGVAAKIARPPLDQSPLDAITLIAQAREDVAKLMHVEGIGEGAPTPTIPEPSTGARATDLEDRAATIRAMVDLPSFVAAEDIERAAKRAGVDLGGNPLPDKIPPAEPAYVIWSNEHAGWWRPGEAGYTPDLAEAGYYPRARAMQIARSQWRMPVRGVPNEIAISLPDARAQVDLAP